MKKIMNKPEDYVTEMLEEIYKVHGKKLTFVDNDVHCLVSAEKKAGKVAVITGGGSGHLPLFLGYVGTGLLDGCAVGDVFQSPSAEQILAVTKEVDSGEGVLYLYGNYNGDIFSFDMAAEMAEFEEGISVETVIANDDVASNITSQSMTVDKEKRRGVAGIFFAYKCAGAAAQEGQTLQAVKRAAEKACRRTRTVGFALSPCVLPQVGVPGFEIKEGYMEIGMGIHGEKGLRVEKITTADILVEELMELLLAEKEDDWRDEVAILVNGLGATPLDELYIMVRHIYQILEKRGIFVSACYVGEYATSMEMSGASVSVCWVDEELKRWIDFPVNTPFCKQF